MLPLAAVVRAAVAATSSNVQLPWNLVKQQQHGSTWQLLHQAQQQFCCSVLQPACSSAGVRRFRTVQVRRFRSSAAAQDKRLADIMKLERLQHETPDAVEEIWMQFHAASNTHIATVLSKDEHTVLAARAAASPLFVLPLSKQPDSFQTLLLQWQPRRLLVTTVEEFKQWGPQAPPHLTVQLFEELKESHGLVLARGDLINPQLISAPEGRALLELARAFYRDAAAYRMVYAFNHDPQQFDFDQVCKELGVKSSGGEGGGDGGSAAPSA